METRSSFTRKTTNLANYGVLVGTFGCTGAVVFGKPIRVKFARNPLVD